MNPYCGKTIKLLSSLQREEKQAAPKKKWISRHKAGTFFMPRFPSGRPPCYVAQNFTCEVVFTLE